MSGILLVARHALAVKKPIVLPNIGDPFYGGYYAGIIDTTRGNILSGDAATVGERFALICAPKSMEFTISTRRWDSLSPRNVPFQTRWDGLTGTQQCAAATGGYEAFKYVWGLSAPDDGASPWYIPSLDEMDLMYKTLKPTTTANYNPGSSAAGSPPAASQKFGYNPSMDPPWPTGYTSGSPAQTAATLFKTGGAQAFTAYSYYDVCTEFSTNAAWNQCFSGGGSGGQGAYDKKGTDSYNGVRPVRRLVLS